MSTSLYQSAYWHGHATASKRLRSEMLWKSWQALVAMAVMQQDMERVGLRDRQDAYEVGLAVDWEDKRRLEALRVWQSWTGVLVMAAHVWHEREAHWSAGYDQGFEEGADAGRRLRRSPA